MDITFHFPPDLMGLLVEAIPALCISKRDRWAGARGAHLPGEPRRADALHRGTSAGTAHRQRQRGGHLQVASRPAPEAPGRSMARWKEESGQHILDLRALVLSERWDAAMTLTLAPLRAGVQHSA